LAFVPSHSNRKQESKKGYREYSDRSDGFSYYVRLSGIIGDADGVAPWAITSKRFEYLSEASSIEVRSINKGCNTGTLQLKKQEQLMIFDAAIRWPWA